jgi:hypothetical protein
MWQGSFRAVETTFARRKPIQYQPFSNLHPPNGSVRLQRLLKNADSRLSSRKLEKMWRNFGIQFEGNSEQLCE